MTESDLAAEQMWAGLQAELGPDEVLVTDSGNPPWGQVALTRNQIVFADEPADLGGRDTGPTPTQQVLMALGGCTAITVRMYAARKGWTISRIAIRLSYADESKTAVHRKIARRIEIDGPLDEEQRNRLFAIAEKCPVHQMLTGGVSVASELAPV